MRRNAVFIKVKFSCGHSEKSSFVIEWQGVIIGFKNRSENMIIYFLVKPLSANSKVVKVREEGGEGE